MFQQTISAYAPILHKDGTVTVWDVYKQSWTHVEMPADRVLASMEPEDRKAVLLHVGR